MKQSVLGVMGAVGRLILSLLLLSLEGKLVQVNFVTLSCVALSASVVVNTVFVFLFMPNGTPKWHVCLFQAPAKLR